MLQNRFRLPTTQAGKGISLIPEIITAAAKSLALQCFGVPSWRCEHGTSVKLAILCMPALGNAYFIDVPLIFARSGMYMNTNPISTIHFLHSFVLGGVSIWIAGTASLQDTN